MIQRRAYIQRHTPLRRAAPPRRRRATPRRTTVFRSEAYKAFVRTLACEGCGRPPRNHAHHAGVRPGAGMKAGDDSCIAMCDGPGGCHDLWHRGKGRFKGWTRAQRRAWSDERISETRGRWADDVARAAGVF